MRRKDREVTDFQTMMDIMSRCQVCRLAMNDGEMPYIVPVNFGMEVRDGAVLLYFHGAKAGRKYDLLQAASKVSFEMDCETVLCSDRAGSVASVINAISQAGGNITHLTMHGDGELIVRISEENSETVVKALTDGGYLK